MSLEATLENDLKAALLARDEQKVSVLRMIKSSLLYVKVAQGSKDEPLDDVAVQALLAKEAKKRQESADLYVQGGNQEKADVELAEKAIIQAYLPKELSEDELANLIETTVTELKVTDMSQMGQVIGAVKARAGAGADGAMIAKLVKERLSA